MLPIWTRTQNGALTKLLGIKQDLNHPEPEEFCGDSFAPNTFTQDHPHGRYNYHRYHHQYYSLDLPENSRNKSPGGNKDVCSMDIQQSPYSPQRPPPRRLIPRDVKISIKFNHDFNEPSISSSFYDAVYTTGPAPVVPCNAHKYLNIF
ncbi:hypothetical protein H4219_005707 [Mycoemilia scoparia]|uniref:Uncharacterized protein n=1 Tax=Mycoemilia scoparia TaxID=417184 RepID=A0A9W7ZWH6_9FUNG|nr:hypothetical protein H4219_005707 [Mycoemilia scoparia]